MIRPALPNLLKWCRCKYSQKKYRFWGPLVVGECSLTNLAFHLSKNMCVRPPPYELHRNVPFNEPDQPCTPTNLCFCKCEPSGKYRVQLALSWLWDGELPTSKWWDVTTGTTLLISVISTPLVSIPQDVITNQVQFENLVRMLMPLCITLCWGIGLCWLRII